MATGPLYPHVLAAQRQDDIHLVLSPEVQVLRSCKKKLITKMNPEIMLAFLDWLPVVDEQSVKAKLLSSGAIMASIDLLDRVMRIEPFWDKLIGAFNEEGLNCSHLANILEEHMIKWKQENEIEMINQNLTAVSITDSEQIEVYSRSDVNTDSLTAVGNRLTDITEKKLVPLSKRVEPRKYQQELARKAEEGFNTIICAPTGSGKTFVASLICRTHLEKVFPKTHEVQLEMIITEEAKLAQAKIFIVVPTFPILLQWYSLFTDLFPLWAIGKRSGAFQGNVTLKDMLELHDIVILTAEILRSALTDNIVKITDASLIILDECHHTMENHPYNMVMSEYLKEKLNPQKSTRLPQIVGLTAIPGAGKKIDIADRILTLCANLDSDFLVTVPPELEDELAKHVSVPEKHIIIATSRDVDPFSTVINQIMKAIEMSAENVVNIQRDSPQYINKIDELRVKGEEMNSDHLIKCYEHLLKYNQVLILANAVRYIDAYENLEKFYGDLVERMRRGGSLNKTEEQLLGYYQSKEDELKSLSKKDHDFPNPKLVILRKGIMEQIAEYNIDKLRAMVFVKSRRIANALKEWILDDTQLAGLCPTILTGTATSGSSDDGGMTHLEQTEVLSGFNIGQHKILLCTSIGEEGIDIVSCNMVVNYNRQTNDISMRQATGRARHKQGVELVIGDLTTTERNNINLLLIKKMDSVLIRVQRMQRENGEQYKSQIANKQGQIVKQREKDISANESRQAANETEDVQLRCKACGITVCNASELRVISGNCFVNPHEEFKSKVEFGEHTNKAKKDAGIEKIYCMKCKKDWGNTANGYPCFKLSNFKVFINGRLNQKIKKWKDIPCKIEPFTEQDRPKADRSTIIKVKFPVKAQKQSSKAQKQNSNIKLTSRLLLPDINQSVMVKTLDAMHLGFSPFQTGLYQIDAPVEYHS